MSSPCTLKINKLRKKNRALLDQLESNSALLECRLRKLKHTAKVEKHSDKSWEDLPPSPLKRKFQCWRARNYSGQVSAVLHRNLSDCTQNSSDTVSAEVQLKENVEESPITSPAKRTRHNVLLVSNPRRKSSPKSHTKSHSPPKSSTTDAYNVMKEHMKCSRPKPRSCHCKNLMYENETSLNEGESSSSVPPCICNYSKARSPKKYSIERENKVCMDKRTLETAKSMLTYSPESVFLRRLKKRSQTLGNLLSPGNIRNVPKIFPVHAKSVETASDKIIKTEKPRVSPKKSSPIKYAHFDETSVDDGKVTADRSKDLPSRPMTAKSPVRDFPGRLTVKSPVRYIPSKTSPSRDVYSRPTTANSALRDFYSKSPPRDISSRPLTAKSPQHSTYSPMKETKSTKKTRKRVCYRKNCYCRVQQRKPKVKRKIIEDVKENLTEEDTLIKDVSSSEEPTSSHGCHCCCNCDHKRKSPPPKVPLLMTDTISSLVDNEVEKKYIRGQCCDCDKGSRWFNKLNDFRQSHYFDCHAYPSSQSLDSARNLETMSGQPLGHKCVHKYTIDDRYFAKPLYSDHLNNSRCTICHLPFGAATKARKDGLLPITLPSKLDDPIIQVSIPLGKSRRMSPRISSNSSYKKTSSPKVKSRLTSRTIGDFKAWMPPPADSLALRYQKGVFK